MILQRRGIPLAHLSELSLAKLAEGAKC